MRGPGDRRKRAPRQGRCPKFVEVSDVRILRDNAQWVTVTLEDGVALTLGPGLDPTPEYTGPATAPNRGGGIAGQCRLGLHQIRQLPYFHGSCIHDSLS